MWVHQNKLNQLGRNRIQFKILWGDQTRVGSSTPADSIHNAEKRDSSFRNSIQAYKNRFSIAEILARLGFMVAVVWFIFLIAPTQYKNVSQKVRSYNFEQQHQVFKSPVVHDWSAQIQRNNKADRLQ